MAGRTRLQCDPDPGWLTMLRVPLIPSRSRSKKLIGTTANGAHDSRVGYPELTLDAFGRQESSAPGAQSERPRMGFPGRESISSLTPTDGAAGWPTVPALWVSDG